MDYNEIYQRVKKERISGCGAGGLFKARQTTFDQIRVRNNDGHRGGTESADKQRFCIGRDSFDYDGSKESIQQKRMAEDRVGVCESIHEDSLPEGSKSVRERCLDEFRHILSGEVIEETEVKWEDCDKDPELQSRLYGALDKGILVITNIPVIDVEYEPQGMVQFYGFDTEDDSKGYPHFYQFATRHEVYISHSFRLLLRYVVNRHNLQRNNHVVWGTNIEYELGNIFKDWTIAKDFCDVKWARGGVNKFELKYDPAKIGWGHENDISGSFKIWDTFTHWKISVAKMGAALTKHLDFDFNKLESSFHSLKYSAMDAIISRSYACMQQKYYNDKGISLKFTPGATALVYYMHALSPNGEKLCKHKIYGTHTHNELEWLIDGLRGGRTEVFSLKEHREKVMYYDINSAYPYSMKFGVFPHPRKHHWSFGHKAIQVNIDAGYEGLVECEVDTKNVNAFAKKIPYLGIIEEENQRYVFPLGTFRGKFTVFEIRKALAMGYEFKFLRGMMYEVSKYQPFKDFVDVCYGIRDEGSRTGNMILRDIGKSLGNNLYGKFGQRLKYSSLEDSSNFNPDDIQNSTRIGDTVIIEQDEGFAPHTNCIWSIYITAITRDLLYGHMINAASKGNEILYCDTDSIFIAGGDRPDSHQTNLGALKLENDFSYFRAILPKTYTYELNDPDSGELIKGVRAKGVPKAQREEFLVHGIAEYKKPLKIRESMRRKQFKDPGIEPGIGAINAWITTKKELKGKYTKRKVLKDGSTTPLILKLKKD